MLFHSLHDSPVITKEKRKREKHKIKGEERGKITLALIIEAM